MTDRVTGKDCFFDLKIDLEIHNSKDIVGTFGKLYQEIILLMKIPIYIMLILIAKYIYVLSAKLFS